MKTTTVRSATWGVLGVALLAGVGLGPTVVVNAVEELEPACPAGRAPSFAVGTPFAALKAKLGGVMGQPLNCLITDEASGDALQWTDAGLAMYRKASDLATFTNGDQHWALTSRGILQWDEGSLLPETIPAGAVQASLPVDQQGLTRCGVDLLTHVEAHIDLATGLSTSSTTSAGVAARCFERHFRACTPASMATYLIFASYRSRILGPTADGACRVVSTYLDNPNPDVLGREMACDLDTRRPFVEATEDRSRCSGPLYDLIWGEQDAS